jgi:hypothetical protein
MQKILVALSGLAVAVMCACGGTPAQAGGTTVALGESDAGKTITVRSDHPLGAGEERAGAD